jgi:hypothetical protein
MCHADKVQQEFEGWGTSLCWFANIAGGYTDPLRTYLADLLFDVSKGLGMQICRYNIGGAGWGTLDIPNFRYGANVERCGPLTSFRLCSMGCGTDMHAHFSELSPAAEAESSLSVEP